LATLSIVCFKVDIALCLPLLPRLHLFALAILSLISLPNCSPLEREAKALIPVSIPIIVSTSFFTPVSISKLN